MKRTLTCGLFILALVAIAACGKKEDQKNETEEAQQIQTPAPFIPCSRSLTELSDTGKKNGIYPIYSDKSSPNTEYVFMPHMWIDAYAGTVFWILFKTSRSRSLFCHRWEPSPRRTQINPSYRDATSYHAPKVNVATGQTLLTKELLPPSHGLAHILAASIFLGDAYLVGLRLPESNIGIVQHEGQDIYFRVNGSGAFDFNSGGKYKSWFNLNDLKTPVWNHTFPS